MANYISGNEQLRARIAANTIAEVKKLAESLGVPNNDLVESLLNCALDTVTSAKVRIAPQLLEYRKRLGLPNTYADMPVVERLEGESPDYLTQKITEIVESKLKELNLEK